MLRRKLLRRWLLMLLLVLLCLLSILPEVTVPGNNDPVQSPSADPDSADHSNHEQYPPDMQDAGGGTDRGISLFSDIDAGEVLRMAFSISFLLLVGMVLWGVMLRGRTEEEWRRHRSWTMQLQRVYFLVLIGAVADHIRNTAGFDDWKRVGDILLQTTAGIYWSILVVLGLIGFLVLQRIKTVDTVWLVAVIAAKTQIGHAAAADDRALASIMTGIHLFAASLWAGGLLLIVLLWRKYRYELEKLFLTFSNVSIAAVALLAMSGLISSAIYLPDLSYVLESRWGLLLIIKLALVCLVVIIAAVIRRCFLRRRTMNLAAWVKLDLALMLVIAAIAGLLTTSEPVPPNEPLHWHVMGDEVHMTADIMPKVPGDNQFAVSVWLPAGENEPREVSMQLFSGNRNEEAKIIPLERIVRISEYGFPGFAQYNYQVESGHLNKAGTWRVDVRITDARDRIWTYQRTFRVY